jgi:hypothetical protein
MRTDSHRGFPYPLGRHLWILDAWIMDVLVYGKGRRRG